MCHPPPKKNKCLAQVEWWFTFQYQIVGFETKGSEWVQIKVHAYNLKKPSQHFCSIGVCSGELFPSCLRDHSCPALSRRYITFTFTFNISERYLKTQRFPAVPAKRTRRHHEPSLHSFLEESGILFDESINFSLVFSNEKANIHSFSEDLSYRRIKETTHHYTKTVERGKLCSKSHTIISISQCSSILIVLCINLDMSCVIPNHALLKMTILAWLSCILFSVKFPYFVHVRTKNIHYLVQK